ncbi:DUF4166 domain-containing protein [Streptomyces sp. NPDC020096]
MVDRGVGAGWLFRFHLGDETVSGAGVLDVRHGGGLPGRLACAALRFPRAGTAVPVRVRVDRSSGVESWQRRIGSRSMNSRQICSDVRFLERAGPLELRMRYVPGDASLRVVTEGAALCVGGLRIRLPGRLAPRASAAAWAAAEDRAAVPPSFHIDVRIHVPLLGALLSYSGQLHEEGRRRGDG